MYLKQFVVYDEYTIGTVGTWYIYVFPFRIHSIGFVNLKFGARHSVMRVQSKSSLLTQTSFERVFDPSDVFFFTIRSEIFVRVLHNSCEHRAQNCDENWLVFFLFFVGRFRQVRETFGCCSSCSRSQSPAQSVRGPLSARWNYRIGLSRSLDAGTRVTCVCVQGSRRGRKLTAIRDPVVGSRPEKRRCCSSRTHAMPLLQCRINESVDRRGEGRDCVNNCGDDYLYPGYGSQRQLSSVPRKHYNITIIIHPACVTNDDFFSHSCVVLYEASWTDWRCKMNIFRTGS